ncbi:MAG: TIGR02594 family protein [Alphaproteobacteria bacterium]|nr:TIGR02594 family protein [Alphaproteobacteria bacterium]
MPAFVKKSFLLRNEDGSFVFPKVRAFVNLHVKILSENGDFLNVELLFPSGNVEGYAPKTHINTTGVPDDVAADIDPIAFAERCFVAARTDGSNAYYLFAVAVIESGLKNIPSLSSASTAFGPFQILESTWESYINKYDEFGYVTMDRYDPFRQCDVAAKISIEAIEELTPILPDGPSDNAGRLPTHTELYLAHFLGVRGAKVALRAEADRERPIRDILIEIYNSAADPAGKADQIINANPGLLTQNGQPLTLNAILDRIADKMNTAFQSAAEAFVALPEGIRLSSPLQSTGSTPWIDLAKAEEAKPVVEIRGSGGSNPEVEKYFEATSIGSQDDDTAWCAAFISWCLVNCGDNAAKLSSIASARAADWLKWGKKIEKPEFGCIAILHPFSAKSSGHVGFIVDANDTHIRLLGGNQGIPGKNADGVCTKDYPLSKVRAWRVL